MSPILSSAESATAPRRFSLLRDGRKFRDLAIADRAEDCLQSHPHFRGRSQWVQCHCRDGKLILSGRLPSFYLKQLAQEAVSRIEGVEQIENRIVVPSPAGFVRSDDRRRTWDDRLGKS